MLEMGRDDRLATWLGDGRCCGDLSVEPDARDALPGAELFGADWFLSEPSDVLVLLGDEVMSELPGPRLGRCAHEHLHELIVDACATVAPGEEPERHGTTVASGTTRGSRARAIKAAAVSAAARVAWTIGAAT